MSLQQATHAALSPAVILAFPARAIVRAAAPIPSPAQMQKARAVAKMPAKFEAPNEPHPADDLSFMRRRKRGEDATPGGNGFHHWSVEPTGDYEKDIENGRKLGREYIAYLGANATFGNRSLLSGIFDDMAARSPDKWGRRLDGVGVGFVGVLNDTLMAAAISGVWVR